LANSGQKTHEHIGTSLAQSAFVEHPDPKDTTTAKSSSSRPVRDEWGLYDPEQAGLQAVIRRVSAAKDEETFTAGTSLAPRNALGRSW
jgi:hypothetical protein